MPVVFFPGVRITDDANGGGPPRYWPLPSGVANNLFDDITAAQRTAGHLSIRKALPAVQDGSSGTFAGSAYVSDAPNEVGVDSVLFLRGGQGEQRASAAQFASTIPPLQRTDVSSWSAVRSGPITVEGRVEISTFADPNIQVGDFLIFSEAGTFFTGAHVAAVLSAGMNPPYYRTEVDLAGVDANELRALYYRPTDAQRYEPALSGEGRPVGVAVLTAPAAGGATTLVVDKVAVPVASAAYMTPDSLQFAALGGRVPIFRRTGQVLIGETEIATIARVGFDGRLHLTAPLAGGHAAGATVRGLLPVSVPAATGTVLFSQRTWTRSFADSVIGPSVASLYDGAAHPLEVTSVGAVTQQWALVYGTDPTTFVVVGNTLGQIATGTTAADLSPINPTTGAPYFTLRAAGHQGTPAVSNALRLNTTAAISASSMWAARTVPAGSAPGAADSMTVALLGGGSVVLPWADGTALGGAGTAPPGGPPNVGDNETGRPTLSAGGTIPALPTYRMQHTVTVVDEATGDPLPVETLSIGIDDGSVCWTLNASGRPTLYDLFAESVTPRDVRVTIDGLQWLFVVEGVSRSRNGPAEVSVSFTGRSAAMRAGEPYALPRNWINEGAVTAAQLCIFAQETTGTSIQWYLGDWLIPDKVWTFAGSPLAVVQRVAEAVGASVICDRTENVLYVMQRYTQLPSEWAAATPDVTIAIEAARSDAFERADRPAYNCVFVSGQQQGVIGEVRLAGTDGAAQAPLVTDLLITEAPAVRQRGRAILGAGGKQARIRMVLPVLTGAGQPGVLSPGQLVVVGSWRGVVRAVSVTVNLPEVEQTVTIERHL